MPLIKVLYFRFQSPLKMARKSSGHFMTKGATIFHMKKFGIKYDLKSFLGLKKIFFCQAPGDDTDFASRFPKHEFLVVRHRAYRRNFRFLG